jgi:hypothetical protein
MTGLENLNWCQAAQLSAVLGVWKDLESQSAYLAGNFSICDHKNAELKQSSLYQLTGEFLLFLLGLVCLARGNYNCQAQSGSDIAALDSTAACTKVQSKNEGTVRSVVQKPRTEHST